MPADTATCLLVADGVKVGVLQCNVSSGWGFIIGSSKDLRCNFSPNHGDAEHYVGTVTKFGVDIGYTRGGILIWDVVAPNSGPHRGAHCPFNELISFLGLL